MRVRLRAHPRVLLVGTILATLLVAALAVSSLRRIGHTVGAAPEPCAPHPCAAPQGFEADISNVGLEGGTLRMAVTFHNHTAPGGFEAVSFRHTSPADFQLRSPGGHQDPPRVSSLCPPWPELRIQRGATAGPVPLCFPAPAGDYHDAQLIWSPDLGLLFDDVQIPLHSG